MATYAIGDLQGCYDELRQLLKKIAFNHSSDRLYFLGDLVNRGPKSLDCLRFVKSLGDSAITVLGNHDLCLLASSLGVRAMARRDTLQDVMQAPDKQELFTWLRHQPLLVTDTKLGYTLVHAGLAPQWSIDEASKLANLVEKKLRGPDYGTFFQQMYGNHPDRWSNSLLGMNKLRFVVNAMTRIRYCTTDGQLDFDAKGPPGSQPAHLIPWYEVKNRASADNKIVVGHWSTLGRVEINNVYTLDTGCVWGGRLTAMRLDTECPEYFDVVSSINQPFD